MRWLHVLDTGLIGLIVSDDILEHIVKFLKILGSEAGDAFWLRVLVST